MGMLGVVGIALIGKVKNVFPLRDIDIATVADLLTSLPAS